VDEFEFWPPGAWVYARRATIFLVKVVAELTGAVGHLAKASAIRDQAEVKEMLQSIERSAAHLNEAIKSIERLG
jgi:hypothetical protein